LATMAHYEWRLGLRPERALELARRALASGTLVASGSIALYYAVNMSPKAGLLDDAVPIFNQAIAQARRRGDIFNVAFMLMWPGYWPTHRGDLRAASRICGRQSISASPTACWSPGRTTSGSWRMRCWSRV